MSFRDGITIVFLIVFFGAWLFTVANAFPFMRDYLRWRIRLRDQGELPMRWYVLHPAEMRAQITSLKRLYRADADSAERQLRARLDNIGAGVLAISVIVVLVVGINFILY